MPTQTAPPTDAADAAGAPPTGAPTAVTTADQRQLCTFYVGSLFFGVDVLEVQEVIRHQHMTFVPLAPDAVSGLINLRGQIVTAIDLRHRLHLPAVSTEDGGEPPLNVVIRTADGAVSLLVDEIGDVMHVSSEVLETPPPTLAEAARALIDGVYKLEGQLLLVLNTRAATDVG